MRKEAESAERKRETTEKNERVQKWRTKRLERYIPMFVFAMLCFETKTLYPLWKPIFLPYNLLFVCYILYMSYIVMAQNPCLLLLLRPWKPYLLFVYCCLLLSIRQPTSVCCCFFCLLYPEHETYIHRTQKPLWKLRNHICCLVYIIHMKERKSIWKP